MNVPLLLPFNIFPPMNQLYFLKSQYLCHRIIYLPGLKPGRWYTIWWMLQSAPFWTQCPMRWVYCKEREKKHNEKKHNEKNNNIPEILKSKLLWTSNTGLICSRKMLWNFVPCMNTNMVGARWSALFGSSRHSGKIARTRLNFEVSWQGQNCLNFHFGNIL